MHALIWGDLLYERSVTTSEALVYKCLGAEERHHPLRANSMQTDSAVKGNYGGDKAEVSRRHSSPIPSVMGWDTVKAGTFRTKEEPCQT